MNIILGLDWRTTLERNITIYINEELENLELRRLQFGETKLTKTPWGMGKAQAIAEMSLKRAATVDSIPGMVSEKGIVTNIVRVEADTGYGFSVDLLLFYLGRQGYKIAGIIVRASEWVKVAAKTNFKLEASLGGADIMEPIYVFWYLDDINVKKRVGERVQLPPLCLGACDLNVTNLKIGNESAEGISLFGTKYISTRDLKKETGETVINMWKN